MPRLTVLLAVLYAPSLIAQNVHPHTPPEVRAVQLREPIHLDGKLDEGVWRTAPAATGLRQAQPHSGDSATQRTEVRFVYDDAAIYVGARMYDDSGARGVRTRLVRRDADMNSDYLEVIFDTYHDHIGRLFFQVNPSGVKQDANGLGGGGDPSWDPVWEVATNIDSVGWTAELRIPFSQLRYPATSAEQTWGLQIWRQENRLNELSQWAWWRLDETGGPSMFGHLQGLVIRHPPGRAEVVPYLVGRSSNVPGDRSDPFFDPHAMDGRVGGDAMLRVTSNLTLNATVNPDFGQVEVDPAVVNLSAFETFFDEKRPFFVEGAGYFGLGGFSCFFCSNVSSLSMLATRRIGRPPQVSPFRAGLAPSVQYADMPENSNSRGCEAHGAHPQRLVDRRPRRRDQARARAGGLHRLDARPVRSRAGDELLRGPRGQGSARRRDTNQGDGYVRVSRPRRSLPASAPVSPCRDLRGVERQLVEQTDVPVDGAAGGDACRRRYGGDAAHPLRLGALFPAARSARYGRLARPAHRHGRARRLRAALQGAGALALGGHHELPDAVAQEGSLFVAVNTDEGALGPFSEDARASPTAFESRLLWLRRHASV